MAESTTRPTPTPQKDSHRIPSWSWPWLVGLIVSGCVALFIDNRTLRAEIKEANSQTYDVQRQIIEQKEKDNAAMRKQNEFLTRLLYTSENMAKFLYTDSVVLANRAAATSDNGTGSEGGQQRAN